MPPAYVDLVKTHGKEPGMVKRMSQLRMLWDMPARVAMLDQFPDVQQIISLAVPSPDMLGGPDDSPAYARVANEGMADICRQWPHKFPGFVASLPMNNPEAAMKEMDFAIDQLGAKGVQILTSVNGRAMDGAEFFPVFERITHHHQLPVWMHPTRPGSRADYPSEDRSQYEIWQVLGWPMETSVAMGGTVTGEHGVGIEKRDLMEDQYSAEDLEIQMAVKDVFDPAWLLNPSKVFPLSVSQSRRAS